MRYAAIFVRPLLVLACLFRVDAQAGEAGAGIQRLTLGTREEAIRCGESGAACAIAPYRLCPSGTSGKTAWLATPFSRVASYVYEMMQRGERIRPMTPGAANGWGVGIYVSPQQDYNNADAIQSVFIRREGQIFEPLTATIAPVPLIGPGGAEKRLSKGFFAFPMEVFAPTAAITIVLVGSTHTTSCPLDERGLATLR
jgi:hypothetical protein